MIERYFEWRAWEYFTGWKIITAAVIIVGTIAIIVWTYRKMCDKRKKRLDRMMEKWEEENPEKKNRTNDTGSRH